MLYGSHQAAAGPSLTTANRIAFMCPVQIPARSVHPEPRKSICMKEYANEAPRRGEIPALLEKAEQATARSILALARTQAPVNEPQADVGFIITQVQVL